MTAHCPSCGYNLVPETVVELGPMRFDPRGQVRFQGQRLWLTPSEHIILGSLLAEAGKWVRRDAILSRLGPETETRVLATHLRNLRRKLREIDPEAGPIETKWGGGLRWATSDIRAG